jgi:hypothetical protein
VRVVAAHGTDGAIAEQRSCSDVLDTKIVDYDRIEREPVDMTSEIEPTAEGIPE